MSIFSDDGKQRSEEEPEIISNRKHPYSCNSCGAPLITEGEGKNWSLKRAKASIYTCLPCNRIKQKEWRAGTLYNIEKVRMKKEETSEKIDELISILNDKTLAGFETPKKIVEAFKKYNIREPANGFVQDICIDVIYKDDLVFNVQSEVDEYLKNFPRLRGADKRDVEDHLRRCIDRFTEDIRLGRRQAIIYKFDAMIAHANKIYEGREKLVSTPAYVNPNTNEREFRYYLISTSEQVRRRDYRRETAKRGLDSSGHKEHDIVELKQTLQMQKQPVENVHESVSNGGEIKENGN